MKKQPSQTNAQEVKRQNAQSAGAAAGAGAANNQKYGTEFASETNAAEVRRQNQQAEAKKAQASTNAPNQKNQ